MPIITLTTDFGLKDPYVAMLKALLYHDLQHIKVLDISHEISPFNIMEAAYVLTSAYLYFPEGSIHIIGVDAELYQDKQHIVALVNGHYFITADNGVLGLICQQIKPTELIKLNFNKTKEVTLFPERDIFIPAAKHIANGGQLSLLGLKIKELQTQFTELQPVYKDNTIIGTIIYIDNYGNVITNISKIFFQKMGKHRSFEIRVRNHQFTTIHHAYTGIIPANKNETDFHGNPLALFNSHGYLEIAVYKSNLKTVGGASSLLGLRYQDVISIYFK